MKGPEDKINEILNSLNGIQRAEARPYMYTRVMARMEEERSIWSHISSFIAKPVIAFSCLAAVIGTNLYFVLNKDNEEDTTVAASSTEVQEDTYNMNNNYILASLGE